MRKIFEQGEHLYRDEPQEHGIGLYLIARLCEALHRVITPEDNSLCGTLFSFISSESEKIMTGTINAVDR